MFTNLSQTIQVAPVIVLLTLIFAALVMPKVTEMIGKTNAVIGIVFIVAIAFTQLG